MDGERKVGVSEALEMLGTLLAKQLERTGRVPGAVVTLGGTALAAHSIRAQSDDVDVYLSEVDDEAVAQTEVVGRKRFGERFKIDATPVNTIWGEIAIRDIEASPSFATLQVGPYAIQVRALSVETLYIVKVAADRAKDRDDVPIIGQRTGYEAVVERARQLLPSYSDRKAFPGFAERLARCIARDFGRPLADVDATLDFADTVREKVAEARRALLPQFWRSLKALMAQNHALISADTEDPTLLRFDAAGAGAPEEVRDAAKEDPAGVSDLAATVLKVADMPRYLGWIRSRKSVPTEDREEGHEAGTSFGR